MKKDMINQSIYIHMDSVINNVATSGISFHDFMNGVTMPPANILLIKNQLEDLNYNAHTGFNYIDSVSLLDQKIQQNERMKDICWIDFEDIDLLNQLSSQEIAELLYLAHTGRHLRSPFYYKLQNNFVYLTKRDGWYNKVYYRNMNHFYDLLSYVIAGRTNDIINDKPLFSFGKKRKVSQPPVALLRQLADYFKEGACIAFGKAEKTRTHLNIPIGLDLSEGLEELERSEEPIAYNKRVAILSYDIKQNEWKLLNH
ncbi:hypothetical protein [Listeria sp. PSOL-1]|uniref:hypothetical protein n=1 Tax=Listeria sp. PSOL-1 TaxID=1844999 RepID=UPI0013D36EFE|nr:hypothetical protein [Listeria sp. PSOL-1]